MCVCVCVCAFVRAFVRACVRSFVRACVRACVRAYVYTINDHNLFITVNLHTTCCTRYGHPGFILYSCIPTCMLTNITVSIITKERSKNCRISTREKNKKKQALNKDH